MPDTAVAAPAFEDQSPAATHCPAEEKPHQPAGEQADCKDHGKEGHHSPAQGLQESRRHQVVGSDQQQLMDQHEESMAANTVISGAGFRRKPQ
jgi:hypothetical protein